MTMLSPITCHRKMSPFMLFMIIPFVTVTPSMLIYIKFFHTVCSSSGGGDIFNAHYRFCAFKHCNKEAISLIFYTRSKTAVTCRKCNQSNSNSVPCNLKVCIYPVNTTTVDVNNVKHLKVMHKDSKLTPMAHKQACTAHTWYDIAKFKTGQQDTV